MADIPQNDGPIVTSSTPEVTGMSAAIETLQPNHFKPPSLAREVLNEVIGAFINDFKIPLIIQTAVNLKVLPTAPQALVTALPFVQKIRLQRAYNDISSVPEGKQLVNLMQTTNADIRLMPSPTQGGGVHITSLPKVEDGNMLSDPLGINVAGFTSRGEMTAILIHEMQHRKQLFGDVLSPMNTKIPSPIETLWYNRVTEADAQATAIDIAYKMSKAGKPHAWEHLQKSNFSPHAVKGYQDAVDANPAALTDGTAKRAAFDGWFQDVKGTKGVDLARVYNNQGLSKWIATQQIEKLALEGGKPLAPLTHADIAKVGVLSAASFAGANYLDLPGGRPLTDAFYRVPNWNAAQARIIAANQMNYESVKARLPGGASNFMQNNGPITNPSAGPTSAAQVQLGNISQDRLKAAIGLTRPTVQSNTAPSAPVSRVSVSAPRK